MQKQGNVKIIFLLFLLTGIYKRHKPAVLKFIKCIFVSALNKLSLHNKNK